jgi:hypothetical protein
MSYDEIYEFLDIGILFGVFLISLAAAGALNNWGRVQSEKAKTEKACRLDMYDDE